MLPQLFGDANILATAKTLTEDVTALNAINHLEGVYELIKAYGFEKYVTFDLGMLSVLDYYTGIIFQAYTYDVGEPIANGGRYDKLIGQFGTDKASIGFSITIDLLQQALKRQKIVVDTDYMVKLLVCDMSNMKDAVKLAAYFRNKGINTAIAAEMPANANAYEEVITVSADVLERYGI